MKKTSKKRKSKQDFNFKHIILLIIIQSAFSTKKFNIIADFVAQTRPITCSPNTWYLYKIDLPNKSSAPISFSVANQNPDKLFIQEPGTTNYVYRAFKAVDGTCLVHTDTTGKASILVVILLIGPSGVNKDCKIENIFIPKDMTACGGAGTHTPFWSIFTFSGGTSDYKSFTTMMYDPSYKLNYGYDSMTQIFDFDPVTDLDERFVEMMLTTPMEKVDVNSGVSTYVEEIKNFINNFSGNNNFASFVRPSKFFPRMAMDGLPGYFLDHWVSGQDPERFLQKVSLWGDVATPRSLHILTYLSEPSGLVIGETHQLLIESKPYKVFTFRKYGLMEFNLVFKYTKTAVDKIRLELFSDGSSMIDQQVTTSDFSSFIYLGVTVGQGFLYYTDITDVLMKLYFSVSFYQAGNSQIFSTGHKIPTPQPLTKIYSRVFPNFSERRWTKVQLVSGAPNLKNVAKIRVYELRYSTGAYPAHLVQKNTLGPQYIRCFWLGYGFEQCLGYALLHDPSEAQLMTINYSENTLGTITDALLEERCRIPLEPGKCLTPKPGYVMNLDQYKTSRMLGNIASKVDYDAMSADDKKFFTNLSTTLDRSMLSAALTNVKLKKLAFFNFFKISNFSSFNSVF